ncbi:histone methylation protein [Niveomyces insectorum RCEF 264]|uniref:Histone-lysine N-methyltransferase, H3 lysine-79 specific n=1 Tax=Niveomyces insectorum RCEF 264 TaxID=1081102 RepID=A0A167Z467_9HYPO|nr:histone methylation protein [Niveomyces insectorum RCEF 264]
MATTKENAVPPGMENFTIGLIGMGDMGRLYALRLAAAGWRIIACDRQDKYESLQDEFSGKKNITILRDGHLVSRASDYIIYSVEAAAIGHVVKEYGPSTKQNAIVGGQTSCKDPEIKAFEAFLPSDVDIVSCHSLHGPGVDTRGQPLVLIKHRASDESFAKVETVLRCLGSKHVYLTAAMHDRITADTQAVTHVAFLSMGKAWHASQQFPWEGARYVGGIENVKINLMLRIYAQKYHVYAGLAITNPEARRQIAQYAASTTELFKLMLEGKADELRRRVYAAKDKVFGTPEHPKWEETPLLDDGLLDRFGLGERPEHTLPNNHLSLLAMVDCWSALGIVPYDHMLCSTPLFRLRLGVTESLFRDTAKLDEALRVAVDDNTFRSDDLEFTFAARGWAECVSLGHFETWKERFVVTQNFFKPRFAEAKEVGNAMVKALLETRDDDDDDDSKQQQRRVESLCESKARTAAAIFCLESQPNGGTDPMGIFNQKAGFKIATPTVRKVLVPIEIAKLKPKPRDASSAPPTFRSGSNAGGRAGTSSQTHTTSTVSPRASVSSANRKSQSPYPASSADERQRGRGIRNGDRKRKLVSASAHRSSPASDRIDFDGDSDTGDEDWEAALNAQEQRKRLRLRSNHSVDLDRRLVHPVLRGTLPGNGTKEDGGDKVCGDEGKGEGEKPQEQNAPEPDLIHAESVASVALKCVPVLNAAVEDVLVELQYPGSPHRERYELVWGKDKIDAVKDIKTIIRYIAEVYLTDEQASPFLDPTTGIVRQLERASSDTVKDVNMFKAALRDFNSRLLALHSNGTLATNLSLRHDLPSHLVAFILDQVYDRTVAPKVELLRKYENGTDNVYGELLHPFVTDILVERLKMTSGQVFVDLGSGVGNVVLQAALEVGCESWGCEMMENACNLAEEQKKEFAARCRLWGISPGEVHLERGDFRSNAPVQRVLKRADVVLVNNQAFTSQLNDDLVRMFLDFKPGCKIVSLKSFVHDHKSASHNINDVGSTILDVETLRYPEGYVSWTGAAGSFCISTRK